jgi:hypothetical protein
MNEEKGHVDGIKKSIEEVIGSNTTLKSKKPSDEDRQRDLFEKVIVALETAEVRTAIMGNEFKIDLSEYNETFYTAIDGMMTLWLGKEACELVFFYLYERLNPDGSLNQLMDEEGNVLLLTSPTELWFLIKQVQSTKSTKKKK